jgi:2-keto-4-pentenoate hydratase
VSRHEAAPGDLAATLLLAARERGAGLPSRDIRPADRAAAYAIQDATLARLGPIGGWKVGAKSPEAEPTAAPLPASGILASGVALSGPAWRLRGIEAEVALRVAHDITDGMVTPASFDAVLPAIEVVETRLADFAESDPLAQLADLGSHGALVLGAPSALRPGEVDLRAVEAEQRFDGRVVAATRGGNTARDLWRLLDWLAAHCAARGQPLRAGQIVTTGSLTGMLFAEAGARVEVSLCGIGEVRLGF